MLILAYFYLSKILNTVLLILWGIATFKVKDLNISSTTAISNLKSFYWDFVRG